MKRDITVYVASSWWRDSDPQHSVVALTADACEKAIEQGMIEEANQAAGDEWCVCGEEITDANEDEHKECGLDAQAWSGVFPESLREILSQNKRRATEIVDDLRASGVSWVGE